MQNVNPDEIAKFSQMAPNWWDANGPMKPLHQLNPLRLSYIQQHADITQKKVLDIGCGGGILTEALAKAGAITTGIDMSADAIQVAKKHALEHGVSVAYEHLRTEDFATQHPQAFDIITCMEMLEHVPNPSAIIAAAKTMLKPGGIIFFSTLNRTVRSFFEAIIGAEYILNLLPKGTHHYESFIRPSELVAWAKQYDFNLKDLQGMTYRLLKKEFEFCDTVDVNYLICFQLPE